MSTRIPLALSLAAVAAAGTSATAQPVRKDAAGTESGAFITRLGNDTLSVERFTRTADRIEGDVMARGPQAVQLAHYVATLGPGGRITQLEFNVRAADGSVFPNAPQSVTLRFVGDSVRREARFADSTNVRTVAVPANALLTVGTSYAIYEHGLRQMRAAGQTSGALLPYAGQPRVGQPLPVTFIGRDSARTEYFGDPLDIAFDREGRLVSWDGSRTTNKVVVRRVADADVRALATAFASRPLGVRSPRDTARATVGAAQVFVDYSRPSVRGRTVWGGQLVPFGQIWRTGADSATHLVTDRDLVIGGTTVLAGRYALFTWPTAQGYQLVINKRTSRWGTEYEQAQDLARVPLTEAPLSQPAEQFTFRIVPSGATGGTIRMLWGDKELSVPFTVR